MLYVNVRDHLQSNMKKNEIGKYFPEFNNASDQCKFNNCLHVNEPSCEVKKRIKSKLHNTAGVFIGGKLKFEYNKMHLPNYGVFDESRWKSIILEISNIILSNISVPGKRRFRLLRRISSR